MNLCRPDAGKNRLGGAPAEQAGGIELQSIAQNTYAPFKARWIGEVVPMRNRVAQECGCFPFQLAYKSLWIDNDPATDIVLDDVEMVEIGMQQKTPWRLRIAEVEIFRARFCH